MDEVEEHCKWGMPTIALRKDFEKLDEAKQLLISYGYVADTDFDESSDILFEKEKDPSPSPSSTVFPVDPPSAEYKSKTERGKTVHFSAFQVNDLKTQQVVIPASIPKLKIHKHQKVGLALVVQPLVEQQDQQLHVKLKIERLTLGVLKVDFLTEEQHCLGYYPYFIGVTIEPVDLNPPVVAVPTYVGGKLETAPSMVNLTSTTTIGGQLGYGPISVKLEHAMAKERAVESSSDTKVKLVRIDDVDISNSASFEWSILRWANGQAYSSKKPHSRLRNVPKLPFGTCANLEGFPVVQWKFSRNSVSLEELQFRIRLEVQMHLVWFVNSTFGRSFDSRIESFSYENVWKLKH